MNKLYLGMGIQAAVVSMLLTLGVIKVSAPQQAFSAATFVALAFLLKPNRKRLNDEDLH